MNGDNKIRLSELEEMIPIIKTECWRTQKKFENLKRPHNVLTRSRHENPDYLILNPWKGCLSQHTRSFGWFSLSCYSWLTGKMKANTGLFCLLIGKRGGRQIQIGKRKITKNGLSRVKFPQQLLFGANIGILTLEFVIYPAK